MSKFDRKKIAVTLAFASLFGSKTSAANASKNGVKIPQSLGAVRGGKSVKNYCQTRRILIKILKALKAFQHWKKF